MKNLKMFMIVGAIGAALAPFALQGCAGTIGSCTTDTDCGAGQTCVDGTCSGGEGEGEGEGGEGEGEGASSCGGLDSGIGGTGLTATDANLAPDDPNNPVCGQNVGTDDCPTLVAGTSPFSFDVTLDSSTASADTINANNTSWITWAANGGDPAGAFTENFCNGGIVSCADDGQGDVICACCMCLNSTPSDLAVSVSDGTNESNGQCVNITG